MQFHKYSCLALLILGCFRLSAQSAVSPVAFSESKDVVPAFSDSGSITLPIARLQVDVNNPGGKKERGDLVVVYDPQGRHHFWRYTALNSASDAGSWLNDFKSGDASVYTASDKLIEFAGYSVTEHKTQSNGLDDAVTAAIGEIGGKLPMPPGQRTDSVVLPLTGGPVLVGFKGTITKALPTFNPLPREFSRAPYGSKDFKVTGGIGPTTYVSISRKGTNWRLVLRNRWDEEVILDANYNAVSSQQLTFPKQ